MTSTSTAPMNTDGESENSMICNACSHRIETLSDRMQHYKTEWHRYNVKRRCAGLNPITEDAFHLKISALRNVKPEMGLKCVPCNKTFKTQTSHDQHMLSNKHKKQSAKARGASGSEVSADPSVVGEADEEEEDADMVAPSDKKQQQDAAVADNAEEDKSKAATTDETQPSEPEPTGIPLKHCLFCSKDFDDLEKSLDHMLKTHGFFIPFPDLLHDLEGLLLYLGEKIGIGHVCLYCNGRGRAAYPSLYAVQAHMNAKCHCKIRFEDDDEDDEFLEFYKFPTVEDEDAAADDETAEDADMADGKEDSDKPTRSRVLRGSTNNVAGITELGELVLKDGTRIGHRSLKTYYKQNLNPNPSAVVPSSATARLTNIQDLRKTSASSTALIASLSGQYQVLALPGFARDIKQNQLQRSKFLHRAAKHHMQVGVRANKLMHYFRKQIQM